MGFETGDTRVAAGSRISNHAQPRTTRLRQPAVGALLAAPARFGSVGSTGREIIDLGQEHPALAKRQRS